MTLGTYPAMDVSAAHDAWRKAFDLVQAGRDPAIADTTLPPMSFEGVRRGMAQARSGCQQDRQADRAQVTQLCPACMAGPPHRATLIAARRSPKLMTSLIAERSCWPAASSRTCTGSLVWCVGRGILEVMPRNSPM